MSGSAVCRASCTVAASRTRTSRPSCGRRVAYAPTNLRSSGSMRRSRYSAWDAGAYGFATGALRGGGGGGGGGGSAAPDGGGIAGGGGGGGVYSNGRAPGSCH